MWPECERFPKVEILSTVEYNRRGTGRQAEATGITNGSTRPTEADVQVAFILGIAMYKYAVEWPSGDCKPIIATMRSPAQLVASTGALVFKDKDDLDWFEGASFQVAGVGTVLIMKHENNPLGLTAIYVDLRCDANVTREALIRFLALPPESIAWQC